MPTSPTLIDLSTGHVSDQTRQWMNHVGEDGTLGISNRSGGWFMPSCREALNHAKELNTFIPRDLLLCLEYAIANDFEYVLFDQDAEPDNNLPFYEINSPENVPSWLKHGLVECDKLQATVVDPAKISLLDLKVKEDKVLEEDDYVLSEGAWFTLGNAAIRIANDENNEALSIKVFANGFEGQEPITENVIPTHIIDEVKNKYEKAADFEGPDCGP
jgi:hypothetical protein